MTPSQNSRKRVVILGAAVMVVLAAIIIFLPNSTKPKDAASITGPTTVYNDPASGEQIVNQKGKSPEYSSAASNTPLYAGFGQLLDQGMTTGQLQSLYSAFTLYKPFASNKVQISLAVNDIQIIKPQDSDPLYRWSIRSNIVVDRNATYQIQVYYWGVDNVQLSINDKKGNLLLDSGIVGSDSITTAD